MALTPTDSSSSVQSSTSSAQLPPKRGASFSIFQQIQHKIDQIVTKIAFHDQFSEIDKQRSTVTHLVSNLTQELENQSPMLEVEIAKLKANLIGLHREIKNIELEDIYAEIIEEEIKISISKVVALLVLMLQTNNWRLSTIAQ